MADGCLPRLVWAGKLPWGTPGRVVFSNDRKLVYVELYRKLSSEDSIQDRRENLIAIFAADSGEQTGEISLPSSCRLCCCGHHATQLIIEEYGHLHIITGKGGVAVGSLKNDPASYDRVSASPQTIFRVTGDGRFLYHLWGGGVGFFYLPEREFYSFCPIPESDLQQPGSGFFRIAAQTVPPLNSGSLSCDFALGAIGGSSLFIVDLCQGGILAKIPIVASALAFSSQRRELLAGTDDGTLNILSVGSWKQSAQIRSCGGRIKSLSLNDASSILVMETDGGPLQFRHRSCPNKVLETDLPEIACATWHPFPDAAGGLAIDQSGKIFLIDLVPCRN